MRVHGIGAFSTWTAGAWVQVMIARCAFFHLTQNDSGMNGEHPELDVAHEMAAQERDISVSEFFLKNRHLLGFDSPSKAALTTVKEAVDNALDACEEAGILPEVSGSKFRMKETTCSA